jgi:hypothetical protein
MSSISLHLNVCPLISQIMELEFLLRELSSVTVGSLLRYPFQPVPSRFAYLQ